MGCMKWEIERSGERPQRLSSEGIGMLVCLTFFTGYAWMLCVMFNAAMWERMMAENDLDLGWDQKLMKAV